jgi:hypothetical protein
LSAIDLDNQTPLMTNKVEDVSAKWYLAAEAESLKTMSLECVPKFSLRSCHVASKGLRSASLLL